VWRNIERALRKTRLARVIGVFIAAHGPADGLATAPRA
jgi:hypothetical protein